MSIESIRIALLIAATLSFFGLPVGALPSSDCKSFHMVKGACRWISGELFIYNGWPPNTRISLAGSNQVYGVGPGAEEGLMPSYLEDALVKSQNSNVRGQFQICPFENHYRNGDQTDDELDLSDVCIQSARNLFFYSPNRNPKLRKWVAFPVPENFSYVGLKSKK